MTIETEVSKNRIVYPKGALLWSGRIFAGIIVVSLIPVLLYHAFSWPSILGIVRTESYRGIFYYLLALIMLPFIFCILKSPLKQSKASLLGALFGGLLFAAFIVNNSIPLAFYWFSSLEDVEIETQIISVHKGSRRSRCHFEMSVTADQGFLRDDICVSESFADQAERGDLLQLRGKASLTAFYILEAERLVNPEYYLDDLG